MIAQTMGQFTTPLPGELDPGTNISSDEYGDEHMVQFRCCPYSARRPSTIHGFDFDSIRGVCDKSGCVASSVKAVDHYLGLSTVPLHVGHEAQDGEKLFKCNSNAPCYRNQGPEEPCEPRVRSYSATHPRNAKPPTAPNRPMSSNPPADASNPAAHWVARNISRPASAKRRPASAQGRQEQVEDRPGYYLCGMPTMNCPAINDNGQNDLDWAMLLEETFGPDLAQNSPVKMDDLPRGLVSGKPEASELKSAKAQRSKPSASQHTASRQPREDSCLVEGEQMSRTACGKRILRPVSSTGKRSGLPKSVAEAEKEPMKRRTRSASRKLAPPSPDSPTVA
uniref:Uncharacterized protein n=1 Tax=Eutreptiella gymnastica TaxID=73025 RepID=A0A7S1IBF5_9EUGL|mmetsp:Transcript_144758/g.252365  ORF Transcript_144758/g.252365 Transcript_144758/m.252365 type:complete len:337 (-) Transcript_144758:41-1051(-)